MSKKQVENITKCLALLLASFALVGLSVVTDEDKSAEQTSEKAETFSNSIVQDNVTIQF